jgi:hypothetical protein
LTSHCLLQLLLLLLALTAAAAAASLRLQKALHGVGWHSSRQHLLHLVVLHH